MRSIYDGVKIVTTVTPGLITGSTVATIINGTTVDTTGLNSGMIHAYVSATTGNGTLVYTLQESPDNSTWQNALDNTGTVIGFTLVTSTAGFAAASARIEGLNLNRQRYLRGVAKYTTGSTIVASTVATIVMGRAYEEPEFAGSSNVSHT